MITFSIYHPRNVPSIPEITTHHFSTEAKTVEGIDISNYVSFNVQVINHNTRFDTTNQTLNIIMLQNNINILTFLSLPQCIHWAEN